MLKNLSVFVSIVGMTVLLIVVPCATYGKDTLLIGKQDDTASLDPAKAYEQGSWGILGVIYEKLVNFEGGDYTQVVPELAESWDLSEDGRTWTFHLRKGITFSTGNPMTADAVAFSLRRAISLGSASSWVLTQFGISEEAIITPDELTVQIKLEKPVAPGLFLACLTPPVAGIIDPTVVMEHARNGDMGSAWLEEHSAGTGPFVLGEQQRGKRYVLPSNPYYWRQRTKLKTLIVEHVADPFEQMTLLEQGKIDLAWNLLPDQVHLLMNNPDIHLYQSSSFIFTYLLMNVGYAPLSNHDVRNAFRYAIDYDGLIELTLQGAGQKLQSFIPQGLLGYNPAMPYTYDLEKAKNLLIQGGYPDGFEIELKCLNYAPWTELAEKIAQDLSKIGITVKIVPRTGEQLVQEAWSSARDYQMLIWEWGIDYPDPDSLAKPLAHSDSLDNDATIQALAWWANYVNLESSEMVEEAARELDLEKRQALYNRITNIILDDGPFAILYTQTYQYGARSEVMDFIEPKTIEWVPFPEIR